MNPTIVIPSYWAGDSADLESPGAYDHASEVGSERPELATKEDTRGAAPGRELR